MGSVRQAASASDVSPFVVRRWISQGMLAKPPWTLDQVQKVRDTQDPGPQSQAAHGTSALWNQGCSCATCRGAHLAMPVFANGRERKHGCPPMSASSFWMRSTLANHSGKHCVTLA